MLGIDKIAKKAQSRLGVTGRFLYFSFYSENIFYIQIILFVSAFLSSRKGFVTVYCLVILHKSWEQLPEPIYQLIFLLQHNLQFFVVLPDWLD